MEKIKDKQGCITTMFYKKSQKIPKKELKIALERAKEIQNG